MSSEPGGRMRRNSQQQPRSQAVSVKLSVSEKAAVQAAAARRRLSVAAYVAETALAAAEGRTAPVGDMEREILRELMRVGNLLSICRTQLTEAAARQEATGVSGPDLEAVAARCVEAGAQADDVAIRLSRTLLRRPTRLPAPTHAKRHGAPHKESLRISWFRLSPPPASA